MLKDKRIWERGEKESEEKSRLLFCLVRFTLRHKRSESTSCFLRIFRCVIPNGRDGKISPPHVDLRKIIYVCQCFEKFFTLSGLKMSALILKENV